MANPHQLDFFLECSMDEENGSDRWNSWRKKNNIQVLDLSNAKLQELKIQGYNLSGANLQNTDFSKAVLLNSMFLLANLDGAILVDAELGMSDFSNASLVKADFTNASLTLTLFIGSNCTGAIFESATLTNALLVNATFLNANFKNSRLISSNFAKSNLQNADLRKAILNGANLSNANLSRANITAANIFGISAWNVDTENLIQQDLLITHSYEPELIVDDLEIAQFIYLISHNKKLSNAIDTITSKVVLILGRFTPERKIVLDGIKKKLREMGFVPILFDFENSKSRDLTETIGLIGRMSKFIVADVTDAKSIPQELSAIVPYSPSIVVVPILHKGSQPYSMFEHWKSYPWVLKIVEYESLEWLEENITPSIINPVKEYFQIKNSP